jgi:hypothetical protein
LSYDNWNQWVYDPSKSSHLKKNYEGISENIDALNNYMEAMGRPFGHRMGQAMMNYVANYPGFTKAPAKYAFADQIEQRILPKLRNVDCKAYRGPLEGIKKLIEETGDEELKIAFEHALGKDFFEWNGAARD